MSKKTIVEVSGEARMQQEAMLAEMQAECTRLKNAAEQVMCDDRDAAVAAATAKVLRERDELRAEVERLRARVAELEARRPPVAVRQALLAAIRTQTVEAPGGAPNGRTEALVEQLAQDPHIVALPEPTALVFQRLLLSLADDTQRLRQAAEAFFGVDLREARCPSCGELADDNHDLLDCQREESRTAAGRE